MTYPDPADECGSCGHLRAEHPHGGPCTCDVLSPLGSWHTCTCRLFAGVTPVSTLQRDTERNIGALDLAEQQLAYWQDRVDLLRAQLAAKQAIARRKNDDR